MKRKHNRKNKVFLLLVLMIFGIGLGYALLSQDLTINGITKVKGNTWDIHFDNVQINSNSVSLSTGDSAAAINQSDNTLVEYTVTLKQPGEFYEFNVDAVNEGTVDGMIGSITSKLNGTAISSTNALPAYINYSVTYSDGVAIASNQLLEAGHTETFKVRVEFKRDIENSELPSTDQTNTFSFEINYIQADTSAQAVIHPFNGIVYTAGGTVNIGDNINDIEYYLTSEEARAALLLYWPTLPTIWPEHTVVPYCIKHTIVNDIITKSDIEFIITEELALANPTLTAGTYTLLGESYCYYDFNQQVYTECDDNYEVQYYESNIATMQSAFGESYCSFGNNNVTYYCTNSMHAGVGQDGLIYVQIGGFFCETGHIQRAICDYD